MLSSVRKGVGPISELYSDLCVQMGDLAHINKQETDVFSIIP